MQWAQRKRAEEAPAGASARSAAVVTDIWALRVLSGLHAGAERKLQERELLMIGSSDDCDIIFSDPDVAPHHCLITRGETELSVRAVDADVRIDDRILHPGDPQNVPSFALLRVGGACFAVGPHWSERWQTLLAKVDPPLPAIADTTQRPRMSSRMATLGVAVALLLASTGALVLAQHNAKAPAPAAPPPARDAELRSLVQSLGFKGLDVVRRDGKLVVNGYVETPDDLAALRSRLDQRGFNATVEAKSGPGVAAEAAERFRMKGMHVTTEWTGGGKVRATGHFGDEKELKEFLASSTMAELNRNLHLTIQVANLDPPVAQQKAVPEGKQISRVVVKADDPIVYTKDCSTYYVNSRLPTGEICVGVENGEVLVRDDAGNVQHLPHTGAVDLPPVSEIGEAQ